MKVSDWDTKVLGFNVIETNFDEDISKKLSDKEYKFIKLPYGDFEKIKILSDLGLEEIEFPDGISIPANLVVIGTVNMDETTHSFSRKVLDRAMTFEMNNSSAF
jgi:5-methylcytosine-specific restriction endonuclease McrBC GTP-binding regulatory subunit McrB